MTFSTNQKNTDRQERKGVFKNKNRVTKLTYKKEILNIYILRNLVETVN